MSCPGANHVTTYQWFYCIGVVDVQQKPIGLNLDNRMQVTRSSGQWLAAGATEGAAIRTLAGFPVGSVEEFTSILGNFRLRGVGRCVLGFEVVAAFAGS